MYNMIQRNKHESTMRHSRPVAALIYIAALIVCFLTIGCGVENDDRIGGGREELQLGKSPIQAANHVSEPPLGSDTSPIKDVTLTTSVADVAKFAKLSSNEAPNSVDESTGATPDSQIESITTSTLADNPNIAVIQVVLDPTTFRLLLTAVIPYATQLATNVVPLSQEDITSGAQAAVDATANNAGRAGVVAQAAIWALRQKYGPGVSSTERVFIELRKHSPRVLTAIRTALTNELVKNFSRVVIRFTTSLALKIGAVLTSTTGLLVIGGVVAATALTVGVYFGLESIQQKCPAPNFTPDNWTESEFAPTIAPVHTDVFSCLAEYWAIENSVPIPTRVPTPQAQQEQLPVPTETPTPDNPAPQPTPPLTGTPTPDHASPAPSEPSPAPASP